MKVAHARGKGVRGLQSAQELQSKICSWKFGGLVLGLIYVPMARKHSGSSGPGPRIDGWTRHCRTYMPDLAAHSVYSSCKQT